MKSQSVHPKPWLVAIILAIAIAAVYGRALDAPFLMDDTISIVDNPSIIATLAAHRHRRKSGAAQSAPRPADLRPATRQLDVRIKLQVRRPEPRWLPRR